MANIFASLILPVSRDLPSDMLHDIINIHRKQTVDLDVVVSYCDEPFNLAAARNNGARRAYADWFIFNDIDTIYDNDVFQKMIEMNCDVVAGVTRIDIRSIADKEFCSELCQCAHAPLLIKRSLFESVGGYCEDYVGWGYEDSYLENKLPPIAKFLSHAYHAMNIHNLISTKVNWGWGKDKNRTLFEQHMQVPLETRIAGDVAAYKTKLALSQ